MSGAVARSQIVVIHVNLTVLEDVVVVMAVVWACGVRHWSDLDHQM
jgi:hypothetical protein